jgi:hypothetical protein
VNDGKMPRRVRELTPDEEAPAAALHAAAHDQARRVADSPLAAQDQDAVDGLHTEEDAEVFHAEGGVSDLKDNPELRAKLEAEGINPDELYEHLQAKARELGADIRAQLDTRRTDLIRAAAGVTLVIMSVILIRALRKRRA